MDSICGLTLIIFGAAMLLAITWLIYHEMDYRRSIPLSIIPDKPKPFGYKMYWYALRTETTQDVIEAFDLQNPRPINWEFGVQATGSRKYRYRRYSNKKPAIFISPPVCGWTLAIGNWLPYLSNDETSSAYQLFLHLSSLFGEAQFFDSLRNVDTYSWVKAVQGRLVRAFSIGQYEEYFWDGGELTKAEEGLGYLLPSFETLLDEKIPWKWPTEKDVLQIAGEWSVNPGLIDQYDVPQSLGFLCDPSN